MTHETAPNFRGNYPNAGERIGPAWQAAWACLLRNEGQAFQEDLTDTMIEDGGIQEATATNLLRKAVKARVLTLTDDDGIRTYRIAARKPEPTRLVTVEEKVLAAIDELVRVGRTSVTRIEVFSVADRMFQTSRSSMYRVWRELIESGKVQEVEGGRFTKLDVTSEAE